MLQLQAFGLRVALSTKLAQTKLIVVGKIALDSIKTADFAPYIAKEWGKVLIVSAKDDFLLEKASSSIYCADILCCTL